jgi:hypothetical protein
MGMRMMKMADAYIKNIASKKLNATPDWSHVLNEFSGYSMEQIAQTLLAKQPDAESLKCIQTNSDNSSHEAMIKSTTIDVLSLPDYQLC